MGIQFSVFDELVHSDILKGAERLLPKKPDSRPAFLLPHYQPPNIFTTPITNTQLLLKATVIFGFIGMFRFSTYDKLGISNLIIVGRNGREYGVLSGSFEEISFYFNQANAIGFYFTFSAKYHPVAHAFFCKLSVISTPLSRYCPVKILLQLARRKLLTNNIFPKRLISTPVLSDYLRFIARNSKSLGSRKFTPHSLRIGGHTFFTMKNMNADFVHFLGRRAISRVCQLYYRASAYDNIIRLYIFFRSVASQHILQC